MDLRYFQQALYTFGEGVMAESTVPSQTAKMCTRVTQYGFTNCGTLRLLGGVVRSSTLRLLVGVVSSTFTLWLPIYMLNPKIITYYHHGEYWGCVLCSSCLPESLIQQKKSTICKGEMTAPDRPRRMLVFSTNKSSSMAWYGIPSDVPSSDWCRFSQ